jgi:hypothetical protein
LSTIQITISLSGCNFVYSPSTVHAKVGQSITWTSGTLGPFAVSFTDSTPFLEVTLSSYKNSGGQHVIDPRQIQENRLGHHHYAVSLAAASGISDSFSDSKIHLDAGCPDIIISDDGN